MQHDDRIRVGDAERQSALDTLARALAEGRLTHDEFDERSTRALTGRTRGDLRVLLADLLPAAPLAELVSGPAVVPRGAGYSWEEPLVLTAKWEDEVRRGVWEVPPFLEAAPVTSNVKLDFCHVSAAPPVVDIVLEGGAGDLVLVVPPGWGVDTSRVEKGMGSIKNQVGTRAAPGRPQIMVRGYNRLGDVKARHPNGWDLRRQERALRKSGVRPRPELR